VLEGLIIKLRAYPRLPLIKDRTGFLNIARLLNVIQFNNPAGIQTYRGLDYP